MLACALLAYHHTASDTRPLYLACTPIQVEPRTGVPVCFYTAARLRTNREVQLPHPPAEKDMGLKHIETQCCAVCDPGGHLTVEDEGWGNSNVPHARCSSGKRSGFLAWVDRSWL